MSRNRRVRRGRSMRLVHDPEVWQQRLAALPLAAMRPRRDGVRRGHQNRAASDSQRRARSRSSKAAPRSPRWRSRARCSASSPRCSTSRTAPTCARSKPRSFTSPMPQRCSGRGSGRASLRHHDAGAPARRRQPMFLELKNQLAAGEPPGLIDATARQDRRTAQRHRHRLHPRRRGGFGLSVYVAPEDGLKRSGNPSYVREDA